jgi:hypothetical protein
MKPLVAAKSVHPHFSPRSRRLSAVLAVALLTGLAAGAFAAGNHSVDLEWNPNPEPDIAGYRLMYGIAGGSFSTTVEAGTLTRATADGLNRGTTYQFVVVAYNQAGQASPPSSVVSYTVPGEPNTAPTATSLALGVEEDGQVAAVLSGTDAEGDSLGFSVIHPPAKGSLTGTAPNLIYRPSANANGSDSFTYRVNDGALDSPPATVSIQIAAVNDAPVATARSLSTSEDNSVAFTLAGSDVDGDSLTYILATMPGKGSLLGTPPHLTYQPAANQSGSDSFTFRVNDGTVDSANATVSISVSAVNDPPVAIPRSASTLEDTAVAVTLSGTDVEGSPLTYSIATQPSKGSLSGAPPNVIYTPAPNANGSDSFSFRVNDGSAHSAPATVGLTIAAVNDPPVANAGSVSTTENTPVAVVVSGGDVEGGPLAYSLVTPPAHGILGGSAPNFIYTPDTDYSGPDSFTFRVNDGGLDSSPATVNIAVSKGNQRPLAVAKSLSTLKNKAVAIRLSGTDADQQPLTFRIVGPPSSGVLGGTPPDLTFKPAGQFTGSVSFTYVANDGIEDSAPATVVVRVKASNKKPLATAGTLAAARNADTAVVLAGSDPDGDPLGFSVAKPPRHGTLSGTPPNLSYRPDTGYRGSDSFTFVAHDGMAKSAAATIRITVVNPDNRAPVSSSWALGTPAKTSVEVTLRATDADGDPLTFRLTDKPANGRLTGKAPNLVFKPAAKFTGSTRFTYVANDGWVDSAPITVVIHVGAEAAVATRAKDEGEGGLAAEWLPELSLRSDPVRAGVLLLEIEGLPGGSYRLEHSPDLTRWTDEGEVRLGASGISTLEVTPPPASRGFYRLRLP